MTYTTVASENQSKSHHNFMSSIKDSFSAAMAISSASTSARSIHSLKIPDFDEKHQKNISFDSIKNRIGRFFNSLFAPAE